MPTQDREPSRYVSTITRWQISRPFHYTNARGLLCKMFCIGHLIELPQRGTTWFSTFDLGVLWYDYRQAVVQLFQTSFPWPFILVFRRLSYALLARLVGTGSSRLSGLLYTATSQPAAIQEERGCGLESPVIGTCHQAQERSGERSMEHSSTR